MQKRRRVPLFVTLVVAAAAGLVDRPAAHAIVPGKLLYPFGVVSPSLYANAANLASEWMRQDQLVYEFEPQQGGPWTWVWDAPLDSAEAAGMNFAPVIKIGQCWMSGDSIPSWDPSHPPKDLSTTWDPSYGYSRLYYDFIYTLISHYRGRFDNISIEAEANSHWGGTPDELVRTTATAHLAAHDADPGIKVFDSGIATDAWGAVIARERIDSGQYTDQQILDFVNAYYLRSYWFHLYFDAIPQLEAWLDSPFISDQIYRTNYNLDHMGGAIDGLNLKFGSFWYLYWDVMDYIDRRTGAAGYHMSLKVNNEATVFLGGTETGYALELVEKEIEGLRLGVARSLWFPLSNQITPTIECVGLIDSLGNVRMMGTAFRAASQVLGDHYVFDHLDLSVPNVRQYVFTHRTDPERSLRVSWYDDGTHQPGYAQVILSLPRATDRVTRTDFLGRKTVASPIGDSSIGITVTETPVYLEFHQDSSMVTAVPVTAVAADRMLDQNAPNPFSSGTAIRFRIPGAPGGERTASLTVYDTRGRAVRRLASGASGSGTHTVAWDGTTDDGVPLAAGIYFCRLECDSRVEFRKMILAR